MDLAGQLVLQVGYGYCAMAYMFFIMGQCWLALELTEGRGSLRISESYPNYLKCSI